MNPPLNCGAKIATKIESANFSVKKVHFSAKTARQGAFGAPKRISFHDLTAPTGRRSALQTSPLPPSDAGARLLPLPHRAPSDTARDCGQARVDKRRWTASGWTGAGLLSFAGPRRAPSSPTGHRGAPPPSGNRSTPERTADYPAAPTGRRGAPPSTAPSPLQRPRHPPAGAAIPRPALALSTELSYL